MPESVCRSVVVPPERAGERLDRVAAELWSDHSRSRIQQWIQNGELTMNGAVVRSNQRLKGGETLTVNAELAAVLEDLPESIAVSVVHEDEHLLIIDKPAGLVVHPGAGNRSGTLLNALLSFDPALATVPRAGLVHRLDKDTSGLLVVARSLTAQQRLAAMIERRAFKRIYHAVCQTALTGGGAIDAPIDRNPRDRTRMLIRQGGREARTSYRLLERFRAHSYVEVTLDTGRTHQIRVHMAHIRAPLVGDPVYGGRPRLPRQPTEALRVALQSFPRQALHARSLAFAHPVTDFPLSFDSPLPADLLALIDTLRADTIAGSA